MMLWLLLIACRFGGFECGPSGAHHHGHPLERHLIGPRHRIGQRRILRHRLKLLLPKVDVSARDFLRFGLIAHGEIIAAANA
jgi:hypothetical protein